MRRSRPARARGGGNLPRGGPDAALAGAAATGPPRADFPARGGAHALARGYRPAHRGRTVKKVVQKYEVEEELFTSGPRTFFRARNTMLGNPVLLRRLAVDPARADDVKETFFREMRHAAALSHPRIQRPLDVMEDDGFLWSVHEFRTGTPSEQRVRESGPMCRRGGGALGERGRRRARAPARPRVRPRARDPAVGAARRARRRSSSR